MLAVDVLIDCLLDGGVPAGTVTVRHTGERLHLRSNDLQGSSDDGGSEIHELLDWFADAALGGARR